MNSRCVALSALLLVSLVGCDRTSASQSASVESSPKPAAQPAPEPAPMSEVQAMSDDAFADLDAMPTADLTQASATMQRYLQAHFKDGCAPAAAPLSFEQLCQHEAETRNPPPSPMPDLLLGFAKGELVSLAITDTARSIELPWECLPAADNDTIRYCYKEGTADAERTRWSDEWSAFFSAGG